MEDERSFCRCCCPLRFGGRRMSVSSHLPVFQSPSDTPFQSIIARGGTVLNRGLGALNQTINKAKRQEEEDTRVCSGAFVILILSAFITIPCAIGIEIDFAPAREGFFKTNIDAQSAGMAQIAAIPLACAAVNFLMVHIRRTTFWWDDQEDARCCSIDPLSPWPMLIVALGLLDNACTEIFKSEVSEHLTFYVEILIAFVCVRIYYALLDQINTILKGMELEQEEINRAKPVKKMQELVRNITRSGRPEKDVVYCFAQTNTVPAYVLSWIWLVYYSVGKVLGAGMILAMFMGVSSSIISHFLVGIALFSVATAVGFVFEIGPNALSLFRLSLNKPFYVGDLVTLNTNGAMDSAATSVMGFVENITMMYVVIRNFEMKQTWIPHAAFSNMIIQNWTRRPSKTVLMNIGISCRCPVKKVERLTNFAKRWIEASPEIQQTNYRKHHITKTADGYNLEIIFFPAIGVTHRGIRQKFLYALMAAAERMQVPFVPLQINQNYCDNSCVVQLDTNTEALDTTALDDLMPKPGDLLPKGVGLGFREFPANASNSKLVTDIW